MPTGKSNEKKIWVKANVAKKGRWGLGRTKISLLSGWRPPAGGGTVKVKKNPYPSKKTFEEQKRLVSKQKKDETLLCREHLPRKLHDESRKK